MKRRLLIVVFLAMVLIAAACGNKDSEGPSNLPVEWVNAHIQKDQGKMAELLDQEETALDPEDKADNNLEVKNYKLTEWKASDKRYFYEVVYEHPKKKGLKTEEMEVIKTKDGWKRTEYGSVYNFKQLVADLEPEVLKELHD
ncbi:hypothetical protein [Rossellomorea vietnamensis]|uniref:hypothetical protein n=1 Tax=Rossellomorea vietnamensis TaxID=218284 RepID=UPI00077C73B3|nr:hypothetical protein [Rossellomorea vietnamensis]